jgi:hypothetical protein
MSSVIFIALGNAALKACRVPSAAVEADDPAGDHGQGKSKCDVLPGRL